MAALTRIRPDPKAGKVARLVPVDNRDPCAEAFAAICIALQPLAPDQRRTVVDAVAEMVDGGK